MTKRNSPQLWKKQQNEQLLAKQRKRKRDIQPMEGNSFNWNRQQQQQSESDSARMAQVNETAAKALKNFLFSPMVALNSVENFFATHFDQKSEKLPETDSNIWLNLLQSLTQSNRQPMRILSPRILPIVKQQPNITRIASPDIFSLVDESSGAKQNDIASLPDLFRHVGFSQQETEDWLEIIREVTAASNKNNFIPSPASFQQAVFVQHFTLVSSCSI